MQNRVYEPGSEREAEKRLVPNTKKLPAPRLPTVSHRRSHIFDGVTLSKETAAFQLCDITDAILKDMIDDADDLRETCHVSDPSNSFLSVLIKFLP